MDPNECLRMLESALDCGDLESAFEHYESLSDWCRKGGFEPVWNAYPRATKYVTYRDNGGPEFACVFGSDKIDRDYL